MDLREESMDQMASPAQERIFDSSNRPENKKGKQIQEEETFTLSFKNVSYAMKKKNKKWFGGNEEGSGYQQILNKVSGVVKPGQSLAIMGSTGSGKTTLLDILACREKQGKVKGEILINGIDARTNLKVLRKDIGYVTQDDYLLGTATVRETLRFVADLRLPSVYSSSEKDALVKKTLKVLGIYHIADSKVGSQFNRGVSGGEKKRVAIGCELITNPSLLFLDEPTTGLDSYNAKSVVKQLTRLGKTLVFTIHQPRSSIFKYFDQLMLMSQGQVAYYGPASDALTYFQGLNFSLKDEMVNPADWLIDVVIDAEHNPKTKTSLTDEYSRSDSHKELLEELNHISQEGNNSTTLTTSQQILQRKKKRYQYETNVLYQIYKISHRSVVNTIRTPRAGVGALLNCLFFAFLISTIFFHVSNTQKGVQDRLGALFFVMNSITFQLFNIMQVIQNERDMFNRERASNTYRTISYFISKHIIELPLQYALFNGVYLTIIYFTVRYQLDLFKILIFLGCGTLLGSTVGSLFFLITAASPNMMIASIIAPSAIVIQSMFAGFYINLNNIPVYYKPIKYLSMFRYSFGIFAVNEFRGLEFECGSEEDCRVKTGEEELEYLGMSDVQIWQYFCILGGLQLFFTFWTYWALRFLNKEKR